MNFSLFAVLYSLVIAGFFIIAILVGLRQRTAKYRNFAIFAFLLGVWQLLQFVAQLVAGSPLAPFLLKASVSLSNVMAAFFLLFAIAYIGKSFRYRLLLIASVASGVLAFFSSSLQHAQISRTGISIAAIDLPYSLSLLFTATSCIVGIGLIFWNYKRSRNAQQRSQDLILLLGILQAVAVIFVLSIVAANSAYLQIVIPFVCLVAAAVIAYAMVYRGLFDIQFFVVRAAAYLTTLFIMTFMFIAPFVLGVTFLLGRTMTTGQFAAVVVLSVALLYLLQFLRHFFNQFTARIFFRHDYDLQDVQDRLGDILVRTADLKVLRQTTANVLQEALKPTSLRYVLFKDSVVKDAELAHKLDAYSTSSAQDLIVVDELGAKENSLAKNLRDDGIALGIKLHTTHEDLGFMLLGHKKSGELYTTRDTRLVSAAADEIAISLQNVLRFEEIQRFNITLQEEVDTATRKLKRQNKRLEELDNIKDDFISMASHQLRTPLTSVKGYLSMVLEGDAGKLNGTQAQMLKQAFTSSQRMVFLITDLLNVSRLKTGKFVIDSAPVNLSRLIEEELEQLNETAQAKNIQLSYDRPDSFPDLMLDEVKTRQVLMNFIDNAIYYTPQGGHVRVELLEKSSTIELRVVDDGIGVPKSEQHHLFTKFYRATNARKARPDGTGLGLFMAQKVIMAEGGTTIFSSQEDKGSTFGFAFSKSRLAVPKKLQSPAEVPVTSEPQLSAK